MYLIKKTILKIKRFLRQKTIDLIFSLFIKSKRFSFRLINFLIKRSTLASLLFYKSSKTDSVRTYLRRDYNLEDFFKFATESKVRYVILRWFEKLPEVDRGEDIDILVHSDDLHLIEPFFTKYPLMGNQKFDIYPSSFDYNKNYNNVSYYPEKIAKIVLDDTEILNSIYRVPAHKTYIKSFCFHILFHKAERSSFTLNGISEEFVPEHNYPKILNQICKEEFRSLKDIFEYLRINNFLPSIDTMKKYAGILKSKALIELIREYEKEFYRSDNLVGDCAMLVIRSELANQKELLDHLDLQLKSSGYEVIETLDDVPDHFKSSARGNNWDKGPYPISGGFPSKLMIVYNNKPKYFVNEDGFLQDRNIKILKESIRRITANILPYSKQFNGLHTTDNIYETIEYARYVSESFQNKVSRLIKKSEDNSSIVNRFNVKKSLTAFGRRADVYKIEYNQGYALLKIFKSTYQAHFRNELNFYKIANENGLQVPKLLEAGDNYFITEFVEGRRINFNLTDLFSKGLILQKEYDNFIRSCHKLNLFNSDFIFANNILLANGKIIFYDFEFMQKYVESSVTPYEILGIPETVRHQYMLPLAYRENLVKYKIFRFLMGALKFFKLNHTNSLS